MTTMSVLERVDLDELTPARLWSALDAETRRAAAESLYRGGRQDAAGRREADEAIAAALRFRPQAVRQLSAERRVGYLLQRVVPHHSLAATLLLALHLERRVPLLEAFLGGLGIPHEAGVIDERHDLEPLEPARLAPVVAELYRAFPRDEVLTYLLSLVALDGEAWGGLVELLRRDERTDQGSGSTTTALP